MDRHMYKGELLTVNELSYMSGIAPATIRDRIRRGYSVEQAVRMNPIDDGVVEFCKASLVNDWFGMAISDLHKIYWKWCVSHEYQPLGVQAFSRQIMTMYPIKTVPTKRGNKCYRIIRRKY